MTHPARWIATLVVFGVPSLASAQAAAGPLEELSRKLAAADEVWVTDVTGREARSRVVAVTPSTLTVEGAGGRRDLDAGDIVRVRQRRRDALWNGALVGAAAALAFPVWLCSKSYETGETCAENVGGLAMTAVVGVGIGALIDSLIKGRKVVYERAGSAALRFSPAVSPRAIGVSVSLTVNPASR